MLRILTAIAIICVIALPVKTGLDRAVLGCGMPNSPQEWVCAILMPGDEIKIAFVGGY